MNKLRTKKMAEGSIGTQNIHRQAICPFQDWAIAASVIPAGIGWAMSQLTIWAAKMPITIII